MVRLVKRAWAYLTDKERVYRRTIRLARLSVLTNAILGAGKIGLGIVSGSVLFAIGGCYNLGMGLAKGAAVKTYAESRGGRFWSSAFKSCRDTSGAGKKTEYRCYRFMGLVVLAASLAYVAGCVSVILRGHRKLIFTTLMTVGIGIVTAVEILAAALGYPARRREKEPILEALKLINLLSALLGLILVQTAILGRAGGTPIFYFDYVGIALSALSACVGLRMALSAKKQEADFSLN
jgi:divalent metal cation (Fe/Co/Zn/Cd) transporter